MVGGESEAPNTGQSPSELIQEATSVQAEPGDDEPKPPPDAAAYQTDSQRRRSLPLSKLKRVKPKKRKCVLHGSRAHAATIHRRNT